VADPAPGPHERMGARRDLEAVLSTLVVACLFTVLPFSFAFEGSRVTFIVLRDAPVVAIAWWVTAVVMWTPHF
jgi:hypothetical protein